MTTPSLSPTLVRARAEFEELVKDIRPELHRYCARMIGSVVDAEDLVQDALANAYYALPTTSVANMRGWLFRIAHNKAIDHLRRANHQPIEQLDEYPLVAEVEAPLEEQEQVALALSVFLKLAPKQRSCVILKDVMGYSLAEISELLDATVPEIKAALHRGRERLRELSKSVEVEEPVRLDKQERELLARYVDRFNARDFDAVRAMLADEVRLDLLNRTKRRGVAQVSEYFHRYSQVDDWRLALGAVDNRPAILAYDPREAASQPVYFMLLAWDDGQVCEIRDYRYARYVMRDAAVVEHCAPTFCQF
ncbi:MAG TPA: sigma-70 family RNA polymerase sigma factor [Roseiflexaceae bacterium]|nr:sigma-70 family RNA polymerase sigma factor [Roseiflexaceae bacterium]